MLKKNITLLEVKQQIGFGDKGYTPGEITSLPEIHYLINKNSINFVILAYDNFGSIRNSEEKLEAKLQKIIIVKQDRTFVEVPTKLDGSFDFEVVKSKWE